MSSGSFDKDDNKNFMVQDMGHLLEERIENRTAHGAARGRSGNQNMAPLAGVFSAQNWSK